MIPLEIEILFHCYQKTTPFRDRGQSAISEAFDELVKCGMITPSEGDQAIFTVTPRGKAHIAQLCALDYPVMQEVWVGADGEVIEVD